VFRNTEKNQKRGITTKKLQEFQDKIPCKARNIEQNSIVIVQERINTETHTVFSLKVKGKCPTGRPRSMGTC
jgi:hypothetical protein